MKHWYLIPLAAIAGMVAGSWGPRADLEALKELRTEKASKSSANAKSGFRAIASLANIPERAKVMRRGGSAAEKSAATNGVASAENDGKPPKKSALAAARPHPGRDWLRRGDLGTRIEEAAELWRTRSELARTQWKAKLALEGDRAARFDETVEAMNNDLRDLMAEFAAEVAERRTASTELGVRMMNAVTGILASGYDALGETVGDEARDAASEVPLHEFIDPSVFEPMVQVQDYLEPERADAEGERR